MIASANELSDWSMARVLVALFPPLLDDVIASEIEGGWLLPVAVRTEHVLSSRVRHFRTDLHVQKLSVTPVAWRRGVLGLGSRLRRTSLLAPSLGDLDVRDGSELRYVGHFMSLAVFCTSTIIDASAVGWMVGAAMDPP